PNPSRQPEALGEAIVRYLAAADFSGRVGIVDDYHFVTEEPAADLFFDVVRKGLSLRLLVASRTAPRWATARARIYGDVMELGLRDLALTAAESTEVLSNAQAQR